MPIYVEPDIKRDWTWWFHKAVVILSLLVFACLMSEWFQLWTIYGRPW